MAHHHKSSTPLIFSPYFVVGIVLGVSLTTLALLPLLPVITASLEQSGYARSRRDASNEGSTLQEPPRKIPAPVKVNFVDGSDPETIFATPRVSPETGSDALFTAVLSEESTVSKYSSAIEMTWGPGLGDLQYFFGTSPEVTKSRAARSLPYNIKLAGLEMEEAYGFEHVRQTLAYACEHVTGRYHWYMFVRDTTYVNPSALMAVLDKLSWTQPIILGDAMQPGRPEYCSVQSGLVLSQAALTAVCRNVRNCDAARDRKSQPASGGANSVEVALQLASCIHETSGIGCLDAGQFSTDFYKTSNGEGTLEGRSVSQRTAFVTAIHSISSLLRTHMSFTQSRITQTREEILRLGRELSRTPILSNNRLKRDRLSTENTQSESGGSDVFFVQNILVNTTSDHGHANLIDEYGNLYLDTCKIQQTDTGENEAYESAQTLAEDAIGYDVGDMNVFAFKADKPSLGMEYQMFYVEEGKKKANAEKVPDRIFQVTVAQPYGGLDLDLKEARSPRSLQTLAIVMGSLPERPEQLIPWLEHTSAECEQLAELGGSCWVVIPDFIQDFVTVSKHFETSYFQIDALQLSQGETDSKGIFRQVKSTLPDDAIVLWTSSDMLLGLDFLLRCQINTEAAHKLYFPVSFQKFDSDNQLRSIDGDAGFWRSSAYDVFCAYGYDLKRLDTGVLGAYARFKHLNYEIQRAPEPDLQRLWQASWCQEGGNSSRESCRQELRFLNLQ